MNQVSLSKKVGWRPNELSHVETPFGFDLLTNIRQNHVQSRQALFVFDSILYDPFLCDCLLVPPWFLVAFSSVFRKRPGISSCVSRQFSSSFQLLLLGTLPRQRVIRHRSMTRSCRTTGSSTATIHD